MSIRDSKETYNKYMRENHIKRYRFVRKEAIKLLGGKCIQCGSKKKLEFDHINPKTKSFEVSRFLNVSLDTFWKEIKKCQLLCKKCHSIKTLKESGKQEAKNSHGRLSTYRYCKCKLCREAWNKYMRDYKLKKNTSRYRIAAIAPVL